MTKEQLLLLEHITAADAAEYLGIGQQNCRVLARSGKIGAPVDGTNKVIFQPMKLIEFKEGRLSAEQEWAIAVRVFKEAGIGDLAAEVGVALMQVAKRQAAQAAKRNKAGKGEIQ